MNSVMQLLKFIAFAMTASALSSCVKLDSNPVEALEGYWIESSGVSHAQILGQTVIFASIARGQPTLSYNISPNGPNKFTVLDGKSSIIIVDDNASSWSIAGVFGEERKIFLKAPKISTEDLNGRFQAYDQYDEFNTDWSEIIDRDSGSATIDQLILYHHNMEFRREKFSESFQIKLGFILISERTQPGWKGSIIYEYYIRSLSDEALVLSKPGNVAQFRGTRQKRSSNPRHPLVPEGYTHQLFTH